MVYKKQVIAGEIPEVKPYDTTKMFRTISETANGIANATAKLAEQNFMNRFDIEQRKQLNECYERNLNNPKQLEIEQQKIKLNLVKALPNSKMRSEAMARFEMHAMPYMQKAKENLYKQTFNEAQASTLEYINETVKSVEQNAAYLYGDNLAASGTIITSTMADIDGVLRRIATPDEQGNYYLTPAQRVAVQEKLNTAITKGARNYFDSLSPMEKIDFAKKYETGEIEVNSLDPKSPTGFGKTNISKLLDRESFEENRNYFNKQSIEAESDLLFEESMSPLNNPKGDLYKAIEFVSNNRDVSIEAKKYATDVLYGLIARKNQVQNLVDEQSKENVLNMADGLMLDGDVSGAIKLVRNSTLDNSTKLEIIENYKKGGQQKKTDNPETYNNLAYGIVEGTIYNPSQILAEYGKGNITDATKNNLLKTLEQKQKPSFEIYKRAQTQVQKVFDKGIMGTMTPAESGAMTYTLRELNEMYQQALKEGKTEEEIEDIFAPENVTAIALKWQPSLKESAESFMSRFSNNNTPIPQARPGQSIEEYLLEHNK